MSRGYLLLPVAVALALIGVIAFLISSQSAIEVDMTAGELKAAQAQYVAQAGLQHALRQHSQQGCGPYTDLTNVAFGADEYDTKLSHDLGGTLAYTVNVEQDTWIRDDFPTNNYATDTKMHIRSEGGVIERPLLRYDLSPVPAKAALLSARAWFYVDKEHSEGPVDIHLITADWLDTDATWDSMGANIDDTVIASIPTEPGNGVWVSVNLTAQVQAWINGESNHGITLSTQSPGVHSEYLSRESSFAPYIEVIVGTPPNSPAKLGSTSKLAGGGAATIERKVILVQQPGFVQLQPDGSAVMDSYLDQSNSGYNNGASTVLWVEQASSSSDDHGLLKFSLGAVPVGARIEQANLQLYQDRSAADTAGEVSIYRISRDWEEGNDSFTTGPGVTWDDATTSETWLIPGGEFDAAPIATTTINSWSTDYYDWDVTPLVQEWVSNRIPNHGMMIVADTPGTLLRFRSSDHGTTDDRPRLTITYSCTCGEICVAPQSSGKLLMVVVSPTVLVDEDQQAKDLFESWGYAVSVISESANQSSYDSAVAANDVVFISETVNSNSVGTKLVNAPIGVVSQDGDYNPDLGLAPGASLKVGNAIDIVSTDHYITRPFAVDTHEIYTADMEQAIVSGGLTADQQTLAEIGGDGSLVVLDAGAAMEGGGTAAGRRVILPLGTRYRFNWDYLNANGRLLVHRALDWGMYKDEISKGNVLLVVVNPDSLTSQESAKKTLFESWGYSVNLIDESDTQPGFDAAVAVNNVVYITEDVSSSSVNTKLVDATIGVVTEEDNLSDEFGMAAGIAWESGTQVEINDNSHYITSPFSLGLLTILTANESLAYVTGTQSPVLGRLASSTSGYGVVTLEAGAALFGGGSAAGRRAQLPWGGDNFDVNHLNDDGLTILQRALEWGAGAENPDFSTDLLFVVANPSALTGAESAKKSLLESWGYTVNLIDDADSVTNFATAFGVNGVIFVSGEVSDTAVSNKLTKAGIGIVNEQIALHDELLLSTSAGTNDFNRVFVINNTHYITEGVNTGWHTIASSNQPLNALEGTLAPGMANLAEVWISGANYDFGLAVVDTGGQLNAGEIAAGRRVQLPWGTAGFDFSALNANGENLMRRAIEWAGGAEIDLGPIAHWMLNETSGFDAFDAEGNHDGTLTGNPDWTPGLIDGGLDFDGSGDYVDVGTFDVSGSGVTMMAWFNAEAIASDDPRLVSKADGTNEADAWWQLSTTDAGSDRYLRMRIKAGGTTTTLADSTTNLVTDQWYFAVATYDNTSGEMKLYLDGTEVASRTHTVGGSLDTDATVPVAIGANGTAERFFNGILDDVRVYDRALSGTEISDLYNASALAAPGYTELYQTWTAASSDTWETVSLATFSVPANSVVEVAVINASGNRERFGGVRAVGSSLDRRLRLHEAESGGTDVVTMHVQTDAGSQIQHYSDDTGDVSFVLLGYWTGASYVELFEPFTADSNNTWVEEDVGNDGLGPNQIAEIVMLNSNQSAERLAGVRASGSSYQRRFNLHEAESGGIDAYSMMVNTDASSIIEVFAQSSSDVEFVVLGYWDTPPGSYVENGVGPWTASTTSWETIDLSGIGVPADAVVQVTMGNLNPSNARLMGVRAVGSSLDRRLDLHKAESGGSERATWHVNADASSNIQSYSESSGAAYRFAPVGWWVLSP